MPKKIGKKPISKGKTEGKSQEANKGIRAKPVPKRSNDK